MSYQFDFANIYFQGITNATTAIISTHSMAVGIMNDGNVPDIMLGRMTANIQTDLYVKAISKTGEYFSGERRPPIDKIARANHML